MAMEHSGFCMKCKSNVKVSGPELIKMSNGRTRVAGRCSIAGCDGRISKIVS